MKKNNKKRIINKPRKEYTEYNSVIGRKVKGIIDRPLGSHHPQYPELVYQINYGYVDGVFANDGKEQDVYFLGVDYPLEMFWGVVVAVYHRLNDIEDKWIVLPEGINMSDDEIVSQIYFQEQYFEGILLR